MESIQADDDKELSSSSSHSLKMAVIPGFLQSKSPTVQYLTCLASKNLNFYRLHLLFFTFAPLIVSGIFYACGPHVAYIDALFDVVSASCVVGLNTNTSSNLNNAQQAILFLCMLSGNIIFVSIITIMIRRHFFKKKLSDQILKGLEERKAREKASPKTTLNTWLTARSQRSQKDDSHSNLDKPKKRFPWKKRPKISTSMIRRINEAVPMNSRGDIATSIVEDINSMEPTKENENENENVSETLEMRVVQEPESILETSHAGSPTSPTFARTHMRRFSGGDIPEEEPEYNLAFGLAKTIGFEEVEAPRLRRHRTGGNFGDNTIRHRRPSNTLHRTNTILDHSARNTGFGGFPNPIVAAAGFVKNLLPTTQTASINRTTTIASTHAHADLSPEDRKNAVSYITFNAIIGRNSVFKGLSDEEQAELGGVEFRALTLLLKIVWAYWIIVPLIGFTILAPYFAFTKKYDYVFLPPSNPRKLNKIWYSLFQVYSAWTNTGMSLLDNSMVPLRDAYLPLILLALLILGGNTGYPIFLRLVIWISYKLVPAHSRTKETLQFLLDHPRRCFLYLFPSHQTWFLVFILVVLNCTDWLAFLVLDIGNEEIEAIPLGTRVVDGLFQSFCVRAAGFTAVSLSGVAPSIQVLYIVMMYIAVYPIAVSIRSTNVYEEKSMGVFEDTDEDDSDVEAEFNKPGRQNAGSYIAYHARRQLAFDMWWLILAVWLITIIERNNILQGRVPWIHIFSIMFEVCSAYGTVGLSLGALDRNTALAGGLRTLSKLILVVVMIRGRHRGLPNAIDRAVLLPNDLELANDDVLTTVTSRTSASGVRSSERRQGSTSNA